jgi:hypothetical protein
MARPARAKPRKEPLYLRVTPQGTFEPASQLYRQMLRAKKYRVGDLVRAELSKPRYPKHHRLVFATLRKVVDNLDTPMTEYQLLSILKIKMGRVETFIDSASGKVYYIPESIAFDAMEQGAFSEFHRDLCRIITRDYLPGMSEAQVAELANMLEDE